MRSAKNFRGQSLRYAAQNPSNLAASSGSTSRAHSTAHYAARQWLELKLLRGDFADEREKKGLFWDRDATVFYGDPMHRVYTASAETPPPEAADAPPRLVVFPSASEKRRLAEIHDGWRIFEADDFALIFKPDSKPDR